jgi:hypothetical protein
MLYQAFVLFICVNIALGDPDRKVNSMTYISDFALGKQTDLNETFAILQKKVTVPDISYT